MHGTKANAVVHHWFPYLDKSEVAERVDLHYEYVYVMVIIGNISGEVWLRPAEICTANSVANELVSWCSAFGTRTRGSAISHKISRTG